jgi:Calx-beta domain
MEQVEARLLLTSFVVTNTADAGPGSLRQAILAANANPGADSVSFNIQASNAPDLDVPVPGFDPVTQTWTISLTSPLPAITDPVTIDGFTQAQFPIPFRYPDQVDALVASEVESLNVIGSPTGGSFKLVAVPPLMPGGATLSIPFDATAATVQARLEDVVGAGNVAVTGGPANQTPLTITFQGIYTGQNVPQLQTLDVNLTGGTDPGVTVSTTTEGGTTTTLGDPKLIVSQVNTRLAKEGNNAHARLIVDGTQIDRLAFPDPRGFVVATSHSILRGLIIDGFGVGVEVPSPTNVGNLIQGNFIGQYLVYPVDPQTGDPLEDANSEQLVGVGNDLQGVILGSTNATVGGTAAQENNVIGGNGAQGVWIKAGSEGNQVVGNQIGVIGPSVGGRFGLIGNGAEGVLVESSSNAIGGAVEGAGNVISDNIGDGIHIRGAGAVRNRVEGNYIGIPPLGGFRFGTNDTGNRGDGVRIENAGDNRIGGSDDLQRNVIAANGISSPLPGSGGAGVRITGAGAARNVVLGNYIGLQADGKAVLGNALEGVRIENQANSNTVGPGNVISANLRGVLITGSNTSGNLIQGNLIGTDLDGAADKGNAREGVRIESAGNSVVGDGNGSQVISGNNVGVAIVGASAASNVVAGNFIGTDVTGTLDLGNSLQGVLIENAPGSTIGGTAAGERNLVSANHWGIEIRGITATSNVIENNLIGTSLNGANPLGNEVDGVLIHQSASNNSTSFNTVAFNIRDGVRIEDNSTGNAILTNSIFQNGVLGIDLVAPTDPTTGLTPNDPGDVDSGPNNLQNSPTLTAVFPGTTGTTIQGTLQSAPNTTYTIQFFVNDGLNQSGQAEGKRFVGQITASTDSSGLASFSADVLGQLTNDELVTATATDPLGNTSEFSGPLAPFSSKVQFLSPIFVVSQDAGLATVTVSRSSGVGTAAVSFATSDGTGTAGIDYLPAIGVLTFTPGVTVQTFTVTILANPLSTSDKTVHLTLSNPTGAQLGTISTADLLITKLPVPTNQGPRVLFVQALPGPRGASTIVLGFDQLLIPSRAVDLRNYGYSVQTPGRDHRLGTRDDVLIGLRSAVYDSNDRTVTLRTASPIHPNTPILVMVNQTTDVPSEPVGVANLQGLLLDGNNDGQPGGVFAAVINSGPRLARQRTPRGPVPLHRARLALLPRGR